MAHEEHLILILDSEGEWTCELAAICVDLKNHNIKDVYLQWAKPPAESSSSDMDWFARKYVHGLNRNFLQRYGFDSEEALVNDFNTWRSKYKISKLYGHAPAKEEILLRTPITDIQLPTWAQRHTSLHHRVALCMKTLDLPVKDIACSRFTVHNEYRGWHKNSTEGDLARQEFGAHCSLYDCISMLLYKFPEVRLFSNDLPL